MPVENTQYVSFKLYIDHAHHTAPSSQLRILYILISKFWQKPAQFLFCLISSEYLMNVEL